MLAIEKIEHNVMSAIKKIEHNVMSAITSVDPNPIWGRCCNVFT